jgi:hypothetical protein
MSVMSVASTLVVGAFLAAKLLLAMKKLDMMLMKGAAHSRGREAFP